MSLMEDAFRYQPVDGIPVDVLAALLLAAAVALAIAAILLWFSSE